MLSVFVYLCSGLRFLHVLFLCGRKAWLKSFCFLVSIWMTDGFLFERRQMHAACTNKIQIDAKNEQTSTHNQHLELANRRITNVIVVMVCGLSSEPCQRVIPSDQGQTRLSVHTRPKWKKIRSWMQPHQKKHKIDTKTAFSSMKRAHTNLYAVWRVVCKWIVPVLRISWSAGCTKKWEGKHLKYAQGWSNELNIMWLKLRMYVVYAHDIATVSSHDLDDLHWEEMHASSSCAWMIRGVLQGERCASHKVIQRWLRWKYDK
jgi:hypothetical protein